MSKQKVVSGYELSPEVSGSELEVPPPKKSKPSQSPSLSLSTSPQYDAGKSSPVLDVQHISDAPRAPICSLPDAEAPIAAEGENRAPVSGLLGDEFSLDESSEEDRVPEQGVPSILGSETLTSRQLQSVLMAVHMARIMDHIYQLEFWANPPNSQIFYTPPSPETRVEPPVPASILPMDAWVISDCWGDPVDPDMPPLERY